MLIQIVEVKFVFLRWLRFVTFGAGVSKVSDQIGSLDTQSDVGTKAVLLHPFKPLVCSADENETIRYCFLLLWR